MKYNTFDVVISRSGSHYCTRVVQSTFGEPREDFTLPFSEMELENLLLKLGRPRRRLRRAHSLEMKAAKILGGGLYECVFRGTIASCLQASLFEASQAGCGLRIRLRLTEAPELNDLPWEYLYNRSLNRFLTLSAETPLVRYLELPERIRPLTVQPPLRVLVVIANPHGLAILDADREWEGLNEAVSKVVQSGFVKLERLEAPTLQELRARLRRNTDHVLHFIGHGGFDDRADEGLLILEDRLGGPDPVSSERLGTLLLDCGSLRLVVLNSCEGARTGTADPFGGVAQSLIQVKIPAVIAMQFEISDAASVAFTEELYGALASGEPIDTAVSEARRGIYLQGHDVEWGTPVLYMRSSDGRVFDLEGMAPLSESEENVRFSDVEKEATATSSHSTARLSRVNYNTSKRQLWLNLLLIGVCSLLITGAMTWWSLNLNSEVTPDSLVGTSSLNSSPRADIVVAPFYGPDKESAREGRLIAGLVERELRAKADKEGLRVLGIEEAAHTVRSHAEASELGKAAGAGLVLWGEVYSSPSEVEVSPYVTLVPEEQEVSGRHTAPGTAIDFLTQRLASTELNELVLEVDEFLIQSQVPDELALRRISAKDVGSFVLMLLGIHKVSAGRDPSAALRYLALVPETAESLRYQALALWTLGDHKEALKVLRSALEIAPGDANTLAAIGDLLWETEGFEAAKAYYEKAAGTGREYSSTRAVVADGLVYSAERVWRSPSGSKNSKEGLSGYLLGIDYDSGKVVWRRFCPGLPILLTKRLDRVTVLYEQGWRGNSRWSVDLVNREWEPAAFYSDDTHLFGLSSGWRLPANFMDSLRGRSVSRKVTFGALDAVVREEAPKSLDDLERELLQAREQDPTQPWHQFFLGMIWWSRGNEDLASGPWAEIVQNPYDGIPYYEFAWMSEFLAGQGIDTWSDRFLDVALQKRKKLLPPLKIVDSWESTLRFPGEAELWIGSGEEEREWVYRRLSKRRRLLGLDSDLGYLTASAWLEFFTEHNDSRASLEVGALETLKSSGRSKVLAWSWLNYLLIVALSVAVATSLFLIMISTSYVLRLLKSGVKDGRDKPYLVGLSICLWRRRRDWFSLILVVTVGMAIGYAGLVVYLRTMAEGIWGSWLQEATLVLLKIVIWSGIACGIFGYSVVRRNGRRSLLLGGLASFLVVVLVGGVLEAERSLTALQLEPSGVIDGLGSKFTLEEFEALLGRFPSRELEYITAVVNHLAGEKARAEGLYRDLASDSERARRNLEALNRNEPALPFLFSDQDLSRALRKGVRLDRFFRREGWRSYPFRDFPIVGSTVGVGVVASGFSLVGILWTGGWLFWRNGGAHEGLSSRASKGSSHFIIRCFPGLSEIWAGEVVRGWMVMFCGVFSILVLLPWDFGFPVPGSYFWTCASGLRAILPYSWDIPLEEQRVGAVLSKTYWYLPGVRVFWTVAVSAMSFFVWSFVRSCRQERGLRLGPGIGVRGTSGDETE